MYSTQTRSNMFAPSNRYLNKTSVSKPCIMIHALYNSVQFGPCLVSKIVLFKFETFSFLKLPLEYIHQSR